MADTTWRDRPVLIYGARKSGTTLLANLLDGSDHLVVFPSEVKLKLYLSYLWDGDEARARTRFYDRSYVLADEWPNFRNDEYRERIQGTDVSTNVAVALQSDVGHLLASIEHPPTEVDAWAMKEVGGAPRRVAAFYRQLFFRGRIVFIVREPKLTTRSLVLARRRKEARAPGATMGWRELLTSAVEPWRFLAALDDFARDEQAHVVVYERLVADAAAEMRAVAAFLDVPYDEVFEAPTIFGAPVVVATSSREETTVFRHDDRWTDGLRWWERAIIGTVAAAVPAWYRRQYGLDVSYDAVVARAAPTAG